MEKTESSVKLAKATAWKAYLEARATAWKAYQEAIALAEEAKK